MGRCGLVQLEALEARALFSVAGAADASLLTPSSSSPTSNLVTSPVTPTPTPIPTSQPLVPGVSSFSLVSAATGNPVQGGATLADGGVIDLDTLPSNVPLAIRINLGPALLPAASARYFIDAAGGIDNAAPFTAQASWIPTVGEHTLVAAAYSGPGGTGRAGAPLRIHFSVVDPTPPDPYADRPQPAPGGTRYIVDPAGPLKTIAAAAALAQPGDVVLIKPGVYHESITLPRSGTADRRIVFAAAIPGGTTVIDGTGYTRILDAGKSYITLLDLTFQHASNALQEAALVIGSYAQVTDCVVQDTDSQGIIVYGAGAVLTRVISQRNGEEGLTGVTCSNVLVKDCITRNNNQGLPNPIWKTDPHAIRGPDGLYYVDGTWQAGGGKWVRTDGVTLDGLQSYGNHGPGIWFDFMNTNVTIRNCTSSGNLPITPARFYEAIGINIELTEGPVLIENCTVTAHAGATLMIQSSRKVTVRNNTFSDGSLGLEDWPRGSDYTLQDITITNNHLNNCFIWADGGTWSTTSGATKRLTIDFNDYHYPSGKPLFRLVSTDYTSISSVRTKLGFELHGTATVTAPLVLRSRILARASVA
jgi:hypothetical protein